MSAFVILYLAIGSPGLAGDATNLSAATGIPAVAWGALFVAVLLGAPESHSANCLGADAAAASGSRRR